MTWRLKAGIVERIDAAIVRQRRGKCVSAVFSVRFVDTAFNLPYVYDYITKLCRQQAEVIQNHENEHVRGIGQGEAGRRKHKRLKLGVGQAYGRSNYLATVVA
jgi:hypothetical protein